jgi:hypothetical protein
MTLSFLLDTVLAPLCDIVVNVLKRTMLPSDETAANNSLYSWNPFYLYGILATISSRVDRWKKIVGTEGLFIIYLAMCSCIKFYNKLSWYFNLFPLHKEREAYEITTLSVCYPFQCLNQLADFHKTFYEHCAIRGYLNLVGLLLILYNR